MNSFRLIRGMIFLLLTGAWGSDIQAGLTFHFTSASSTPQQVIDGFYAAGALWSNSFHDDVDVNLNIIWGPFPGAISLFNASNFSYTQVRDALHSDRSSAADYLAASHLQSTDSLSLLINRTLNSPYGAGSGTPYLDNNGNANNTTVALTYANAKALGLRDAHDPELDGRIIINSRSNWNYAPGGSFIHTAAHEIGHALGFISGVDAIDYNSGVYQDDWFTAISSLDYFRYSTLSLEQGTNIFDWSADDRDKYFSIDGGLTPIGSFSTGENWGNGIQNSHWRFGTTGVMGYGSSMITDNDLLALDVIGWDLVEVPEASTTVLMLFGTTVGIVLIRCRSANSTKSMNVG